MKPENVARWEKRIDDWLAEIEAGSRKIRDNPNMDAHFVFGYQDRWDAIKSEAFNTVTQITRKLNDAKAQYDDALRAEMAKVNKRRQSDFSAKEERLAAYETKVLDQLQALRSYENIVDQFNKFLGFLKEKNYWLDAKRYYLLGETKRETYITSREIMTTD